MDRCSFVYNEKDGCVTLCTREANHREACFWPEHRPHFRWFYCRSCIAHVRQDMVAGHPGHDIRYTSSATSPVAHV